MNLSKLKLIFSLTMLAASVLFFNACTKEENPKPKKEVPAPTISSFTPDSGLAGDEVTINGTNFSTTLEENVVKFSGNEATVKSASATKLTVIVPDNAATGKITVTVDEQTATSVNTFTILHSPEITEFSPMSALVGEEITILGNNFGETDGSNTVKINGTEATVTSFSATTIKVTVPEGASSGKIAVTVNGLTTSSAEDFTVIYPPTISNFSPESGSVGDEVIINGENFSATASENTVEFNGIPTTVTAASATSLTVTVPAGASTGKLTVTVKGLTTSSAEDFTIIHPPVISSFSPESGSVGDEVIINGENFSVTASENTVEFNGVSTTVTSASATSLKVTVPAGASTGAVTVTVNGQTVASTNDFTVVFVKQVIAGFHYSLILRSDNTLWATGDNNFGQLGQGGNSDRVSPQKIMAGVKTMAGGTFHTLILKEDNTLWTTGRNNVGQLGDGTNTDRNTPAQIMEHVKAIAVGTLHTMILKEDNTLWATGYNGEGQLGDGTNTDRNTPAQIMEHVKAIAAWGNHTMILKEDNTLWATGWNSYGQIGDGTTTDVSTPKQIMENVKAVSAGYGYTMILKEDNTLWATGDNDSGQLGDGTTTNRSTPVQVMENVKSVAAGGNHTMVLKDDNTLWATGLNHQGQLFDNTVTDRSTPVQVMENVKSVAAGGSHSLVLKNDDSLWGAGYNEQGQLGDGTYTNRNTPVQITF